MNCDMTLTFKHNLNRFKMNQRVKYLGQRSFHSKVIDTQTHTHTHPIDCSTWTDKADGEK